MKRWLLLLCFAVPQAWAYDWNIRTSPLGLAIGIANVRLDYALSPSWVIGPEVGFLNRTLRDVKMRAGGVGVAAMYYFDSSLEDSAFLEGAFSVSRIRAKALQDGNEYSADFDNNSFRFLAGYQWFWSGWNLSLGAGLGTNSAGRVRIVDSSGTEVDSVHLRPVVIALDVSLGFAF